jgi:hypothetical protein
MNEDFGQASLFLRPPLLYTSLAIFSFFPNQSAYLEELHH